MALARRLLASALALAAAPLAHAQDVTAAVPHDISVTVYRDPYRGQGGFDLNYLNGFAFITETRRAKPRMPGMKRSQLRDSSQALKRSTSRADSQRRSSWVRW